ncbi:glyoxalase [Legionella maioricensis]|uniref:Glyoxalase n=1 Tax=Legionella maioricensis TaxID=2896528 RepID=A0A9X2D0U6_9GAMM|nr:glyoxalase [Legionella maioricensis]MCL9684371.1 glyoxalase [Legionella maioricensis]MCL9687552.1 glyoxalase [Legionella maioricensis]
MRKVGSLVCTVLMLADLSLMTVNAAQNSDFSVGPQYNTTHVYVAPGQFDRFIASFMGTFGGNTSPQGIFQVTPTPSQTMSQLGLTPVGAVSVFGFKTPIPYPFGLERTGYLVKDLDKALAAARDSGADVVVAPFSDPVGRDAIIQWPGGVYMQLYWHNIPPSYAKLKTIPENRVYLSPDSADLFIKDFLRFSKGKVVSDNPNAPGIEIGQPDKHYRRVRIESGFGRMLVIITNGDLVWPYGREITGYEVPNLKETLAQAQIAGATILVEPVIAEQRLSAMVKFPGGYIAEIHEISSLPAAMEKP